VPTVGRAAGVSWAAPSPGGCRCAEGGTPDPCPRDHPARPGVKLERPQAARLPRAVAVGRRWRPRTNELEAGRFRAGWYFPPGEGIGRTRLGAGSRPRRGRFRPQGRPRWAISKRNCEQPPGPIYDDSRPPRLPPDGSPDPSPDGSPNPSPDGSPWGWGTWGRRPRAVCAGQTLRPASLRRSAARLPAGPDSDATRRNAVGNVDARPRREVDRGRHDLCGFAAIPALARRVVGHLARVSWIAP